MRKDACVAVGMREQISAGGDDDGDEVQRGRSGKWGERERERGEGGWVVGRGSGMIGFCGESLQREAGGDGETATGGWFVWQKRERERINRKTKRTKSRKRKKSSLYSVHTTSHKAPINTRQTRQTGVVIPAPRTLNLQSTEMSDV